MAHRGGAGIHDVSPRLAHGRPEPRSFGDGQLLIQRFRCCGLFLGNSDLGGGLGLLLGWARLRTRSVVPGIAIHALYNLTLLMWLDRFVGQWGVVLGLWLLGIAGLGLALRQPGSSASA